jgi:hypothetical protein
MNAWGSLALLPNELLVNIRCLSLARNHNNHTATAMGDTPLAVVPIKHRVICVERVRSTVQRQLARSGTHACCFAMLKSRWLRAKQRLSVGSRKASLSQLHGPHNIHGMTQGPNRITLNHTRGHNTQPHTCPSTHMKLLLKVCITRHAYGDREWKETCTCLVIGAQ